MTEQTLDQLRAGAHATVARYQGAPPTRLLEMGVLPGTSIEVVRLAPLGDPMELRVRGYLLSIRKDEAARIVVTPH